MRPRRSVVTSRDAQPANVADGTAQALRLKSSGADTLMLFATPKFAIFGYVGSFRLGWHPHVYVTSVSIDPAVMQIVRLNTGPQTGVGATSTGFLHDPTNPTQKRSAGVRLP